GVSTVRLGSVVQLCAGRICASMPAYAYVNYLICPGRHRAAVDGGAAVAGAAAPGCAAAGVCIFIGGSDMAARAASAAPRAGDAAGLRLRLHLGCLACR